MATLAARINDLATAIANTIRDAVLPRLLPSGGTTGQALVKTSNTNYATGWTTVAGVGGGTTVNYGTAVVDFGATHSDLAAVSVTGQSGILVTSHLDAWIVPVATADHTADEHIIEELTAYAGAIVAGTGFTITVKCPSYTTGQFTVAWSWI